MRSKCLVFVLLLGIVPCTRAAAPGPIDCTHLLAWTAASVPSRKLISMVEARGIAFSPTEKAIAGFRNAGAMSRFLDVLQKAKPQGTTTCPAPLAQAGALIRSRNFVDSTNLVDALTDKDPRNDALHFLMGYIRQRQGDWNGAFDEYSTSKESDASFSETHNRLALFFYQAEDGDSAVAEARTALSMDFDDPGAYRMLGLGHYANEQYSAALNAFEQSLARDPNNAEV